MKKTFLSFVVASSMIYGCQKTNMAPNEIPSSNLASTEKLVKHSNARTKPSYRILFLSNDKKYCFCISKGGNCLPDVVVKPHSAADMVINQIREVIDKGQVNVQKVFSDNYDLLTTLFETIDIDQVIKGDLIVSTASSENGAIRFLIFRQATTNEIEVGYPFVY